MSTTQSLLDNHAGFSLPGLALRSGGVRSWALAAAFAYSSRWNRRRLEWHLYALWAMIMSDLVADLSPHALVVPQFGFDSVPKEHLKGSTGTCKVDDQNSDEHEAQSSEEDETEEGEQLSDLELVSASIADASFETISVKGAKTLIPDFSILLLEHHLRGWDIDELTTMGIDDPLKVFDNWDAIEIQDIKVPCIRMQHSAWITMKNPILMKI